MVIPSDTNHVGQKFLDRAGLKMVDVRQEKSHPATKIRYHCQCSTDIGSTVLITISDSASCLAGVRCGSRVIR
jgi:hypothetical protein